jgi:hypothetical protein
VLSTLTYCTVPVPRRFYKKGERTSSLLYIYSCCTYVHGAFSVISGASSVEIWHPPRIGREKGSEEGRGRGNEWGAESQYS